MYSVDDVRTGLGWLFHGGPWREGEPEGGMPRSASNPATRGTEMAMVVDVGRVWGAWREDAEHAIDCIVLRAHIGRGDTYGELASALGLGRTDGQVLIANALRRFSWAVNRGVRPSQGEGVPSPRVAHERLSDRHTGPETNKPHVHSSPWIDLNIVEDDGWGPPCPKCNVQTPVASECVVC